MKLEELRESELIFSPSLINLLFFLPFINSNLDGIFVLFLFDFFSNFFCFNRHFFVFFSSLSVFSRPFSSLSFVSCSVGFVKIGNVGNKWIVRIRIGQKWANRKKNFGNGERRRPLILQNIETNASVWIAVFFFWFDFFFLKKKNKNKHIWVENSSFELNLGWLERIILKKERRKRLRKFQTFVNFFFFWKSKERIQTCWTILFSRNRFNWEEAIRLEKKRGERRKKEKF